MYKVFYSKSIKLKCLVDDSSKLLLEAVPLIMRYDGFHRMRFEYRNKRLMIIEGYSPYEYDEKGNIYFYEDDEYIKLDQQSVHPIFNESNKPNETVEDYINNTHLLQSEEFDNLDTARLFYELK